MAKPRPILCKKDGKPIHACPYCRRFVVRASGLRQCWVCGGWVDNDRTEPCPDDVVIRQKGPVSWRP